MFLTVIKPISHRSNFVRCYSSHHSSRPVLLPCARTPHSPGLFHYSCWAGLNPKTCNPERDIQILKKYCSILGWFKSTLSRDFILVIKQYESCLLRCGQWGPVHPFPLPFYSFISQSNPNFFLTSIQAIDEGL